MSKKLKLDYNCPDCKHFKHCRLKNISKGSAYCDRKRGIIKTSLSEKIRRWKEGRGE